LSVAISGSGPTAAERSDEVLARRGALGDREAFGELIRRHGPALYRYGVRMLDGQHHAAEDALQEALIKAWLNLSGFRGDSSVKTWLFRLMANQCLDARRRRRPLSLEDARLAELPTDDTTAADALVQARELREALDVALAELSWRQRASWMLRELEGLDYTEIAVVLDTSVAVVRGQLHRARANLAARMEMWR